MLHALRRMTAGTAPLAVVALLVACGPPAATDLAVAPAATPTLALPSPAQPTTPAPAPTPKPVVKPTPTATPVAKPTPKPVVKPAPSPAPKPVARPAPKPVYKPAPKPAVKPAPMPAPAPAPRAYSKPAVSTGGCAVYDMALREPALRNLPAFTVKLGGTTMLTHAAGGTKLTSSFSGSWHFAGPFEIAPADGKEANLTNTRAGISGSLTAAGRTAAFSGSWPYCT